MSKTFNKNIPYTFSGAINLSTSAGLNITNNSNTIGSIITTGGSVGIGTTAFSSKLSVAGFETSANGQNSAILIQNTAATSGNAWLLRAGAVGTNTPASGFSIADSVGYKMVITSSGNVGIGITAPSSRLHVVMGDATSAGSTALWDSTYSVFGQSSNTGGAVGIGYHSASGGCLVSLSPNVAWQPMTYRGANHQFVISGTVGTPPSMVLNSSGNLGIGTTAPTQRLTISETQSPFLRFERSGAGLYDFEIGMNNSADLIFRGGANASGSGLTEYMRIRDGGLVGIGTTAPQSSFTTTLNGGVHISGASGAMDNGTYSYCQIVLNDTDIAARSHLSLIRSGQSVSFFKVNTSNQLVISMGGGGVYLANNATSWTAVSDRTMKTDFADIVAPLDKLSQIKGTYYRYLTDASDVKRVGVIAQDVQAVLPEAISEDVDGILGVSYTDIIPLTIEAIKELKTKNNELQTYIQTLEARLTKLEQQ